MTEEQKRPCGEGCTLPDCFYWSIQQKVGSSPNCPHNQPKQEAATGVMGMDQPQQEGRDG
jgi:hypothetical protein